MATSSSSSKPADDGRLFSIELKTGQVKMLCEGNGFHNIVPYSSWCTLALEAAAASTSEEPTTGASSASEALLEWKLGIGNHNECKLYDGTIIT